MHAGGIKGECDVGTGWGVTTATRTGTITSSGNGVLSGDGAQTSAEEDAWDIHSFGVDQEEDELQEIKTEDTRGTTEVEQMTMLDEGYTSGGGDPLRPSELKSRGPGQGQLGSTEGQGEVEPSCTCANSSWIPTGSSSTDVNDAEQPTIPHTFSLPSLPLLLTLTPDIDGAYTPGCPAIANTELGGAAAAAAAAGSSRGERRGRRRLLVR